MKQVRAARKPGGSKAGPPAGGELALVPDKLYFRIGEVAELCQVEPFVLRYWQTEFPQLKPGKSGTGQRLYRRRDVEMALRIRRLLHDEGYTIAGARQALAADRAAARAQPKLPMPEPGGEQAEQAARAEARLRKLRAELRELHGLLSQPPGLAKARGGRPEVVRPKSSSEPGPLLFGDE